MNTLEEKMNLDLKIIEMMHNLKKFKTDFPHTYKSKNEYTDIFSKLKELLRTQKEIDQKRYIINFFNVPELKEQYEREQRGIQVYSKLSQKEKEYLKANNYDYRIDKFNLFCNMETPSNDFTLGWKMLQFS